MPPEPTPDALREQPATYKSTGEFAALIDELYREEVIEARRMSPADKILAGQRLFESACRMTLAGIRNQNPGASEDRCLEILRERLALARRMEESE